MAMWQTTDCLSFENGALVAILRGDTVLFLREILLGHFVPSSYFQQSCVDFPMARELFALFYSSSNICDNLCVLGTSSMCL